MGSEEFAEAWIFYSEKEENTNMTEKRVLNGYSKEERAELEEAKNNNFSSAIDLIHGIGDGYIDCRALYEKYYREDTNDNNQMAKDIVDFYCGNAKFPKQKYYIKMPEDKNRIAKIEVPTIFDEWYKGFPNMVRNKLAISEIAREGCGHSIVSHTESRAYFEKSELNSLADFLNNNSKILIEMLNKYASKAYYVKTVKKYYVQLIKNNNSSYLNKCAPNGFYMPDSCRQDKLTQTQFTEDEIKAIDPRYMAFAVPVEADDE